MFGLFKKTPGKYDVSAVAKTVRKLLAPMNNDPNKALWSRSTVEQWFTNERKPTIAGVVGFVFDPSKEAQAFIRFVMEHLTDHRGLYPEQDAETARLLAHVLNLMEKGDALLVALKENRGFDL